MWVNNLEIETIKHRLNYQSQNIKGLLIWLSQGGPADKPSNRVAKIVVVSPGISHISTKYHLRWRNLEWHFQTNPLQQETDSTISKLRQELANKATIVETLQQQIRCPHPDDDFKSWQPITWWLLNAWLCWFLMNSLSNNELHLQMNYWKDKTLEFFSKNKLEITNNLY